MQKFSAFLDEILYLYELMTLLCNNQYISPVFQVNCTFYHKMILVLIQWILQGMLWLFVAQQNHWMMFLPMCHTNKLINSLLIFCKFTCCLCCYYFHRSLQCFSLQILKSFLNSTIHFFIFWKSFPKCTCTYWSEDHFIVLKLEITVKFCGYYILGLESWSILSQFSN